MSLEKYLQLKHRSAIRGTACHSVVGEYVNLTKEMAENIAKAFCVWLISRTGKTTVRVAVGYDVRTSSPMLCEAVTNAIISTGHDVLCLGLTSAPALETLVHTKEDCQGAIMITADNAPVNQNGFTFFAKKTVQQKDIQEILTVAHDFRFASPTTFGNVENVDYMRSYADELVEYVRTATGSPKPLLNKKILVDAGNGVGGFFVDYVLTPLGATTDGSLHLSPNGYFPNGIPSADKDECVQELCDAVVNENAHLGIFFNANATGVAFVDDMGNILRGDDLLALVSAIVLQEKTGTIVTQPTVSDGLSAFIENYGGTHARHAQCFRKNIEYAKAYNEKGTYAPVAMTNTHCAFLERGFVDDGAFLACKLLVALFKQSLEDKKLTDLVASLQSPKETYALRLQRLDGVEKTALHTVMRDFKAYAKSLYYACPESGEMDGVRLRYDEKHGDGWAFMKVCNCCNALPVYVQSNAENGVVKMLKDLYYFLRPYAVLDLSPIESYVAFWREDKKDQIKEDWQTLYFC